MNDFDYFNEQPDEHPTKRSVIEYVAGIGIPILAMFATIAVGWNGQHTKVLWGLIGVAALALLTGPIRWLASVVERIWNRFQDWRASRRYYPRLLKQVCRFREFVASSRADTLHYLSESVLCQGHADRFAKLQMPNVAAWKGRADLFCLRMSQQRPSPRVLFHAALEFEDMVGTYINLCAECVFSRMPRELRETMTPEAKSALDSFQKGFHTFQHESEQLLQEIATSRPYFARLHWQFTRVKPLG
ncbi:MAG: hypothetical protein WBP92_12805 [Candidatus Acidiferrales bacterium]